jgi:hypothetical protein
MSDLKDYGRLYWGVKVHEEISNEGEIYLYADYFSVNTDGSLMFFSHDDKICEDVMLYCLAQGTWMCCYSASILDGSPVSVKF